MATKRTKSRDSSGFTPLKHTDGCYSTHSFVLSPPLSIALNTKTKDTDDTRHAIGQKAATQKQQQRCHY